MGKCVAYTAGAITFMGIGALATGLALYFIYIAPSKTAYSPDALDRQIRAAKCELQTMQGFTVSGTVSFIQQSFDDDVEVEASIAGLLEGLHGFHIHEFGVRESDCVSTGGHYNPAGEAHGGPNSTVRHVGDLGNIDSVGDSFGTVAIVNISDSRVKLSGPESVVGRAVVVHEDQDDLGSSTHSSGNAGGRVACCTIYLTQP